MNTRRSVLWIGSLVVVAAVAVGATWAVAGGGDSSGTAMGEPTSATSAESGMSTTESRSASEKPSWLFSEGAGGGTFTTNADGTHTLTLTDMDPKITAFTDRPDRDSAIVPIEMLFNSWARLFKDSPPNAVLVEHEPAGETSSYVLTLTDPTLDGTTGTFAATVVKGQDHSDQVPGLAPAPDTPPPATFGAVSLFIDDVTADSVAACISHSDQTLVSPPGTIPLPAVNAQTEAMFYELCTKANGYVSVSGPCVQAYGNTCIPMDP